MPAADLIRRADLADATKEANAALTTFFFGMAGPQGGQSAPAGRSVGRPGRALLGAGMIGAALRWAHVARALSTVLNDTTFEKVRKGQPTPCYWRPVKHQARSMTQEKKAALLGLITPAITA